MRRIRIKPYKKVTGTRRTFRVVKTRRKTVGHLHHLKEKKRYVPVLDL